MSNRIRRSADLFRSSWRVLRTHRSLLLLPILSGLATLVVVASFVAPVAALVISDPALRHEIIGEIAEVGEDSASSSATGDASEASGPTGTTESGLAEGWEVVGILYMLAFYLVTSFVVIFFNAALIAAANAYFDGRPSGLAVGLSLASKRLPQIVGWSIVAALIGTILRMISERSGLVGRIVIGIIGMAWSIASYFAVPALVIEGVGPIAALKRSVATLRENWGESLVIAAGFSLIGGLVLLVSIPAIVAGAIMVGIEVTGGRQGSLGMGVLGGVICVGGILALVGWVILEGTLKGITQTALYRFAKTGEVPEGFDREHLQGAFQSRQGSRPA